MVLTRIIQNNKLCTIIWASTSHYFLFQNHFWNHSTAIVSRGGTIISVLYVSCLVDHHEQESFSIVSAPRETHDYKKFFFILLLQEFTWWKEKMLENKNPIHNVPVGASQHLNSLQRVDQVGGVTDYRKAYKPVQVLCSFTSEQKR